MFSKCYYRSLTEEDEIKCYICNQNLRQKEIDCYPKIKDTSPETIVCKNTGVRVYQSQHRIDIT